MGRRFRRRPPAAVTIFLLLAVVVVARLGWQFLQTADHPATVEQLAEGLYQVERVVDGDTIIVRIQTNGQPSPARVRLLGIDTPESVKPNHPVEPWGLEAADFTRRFVSRGTVQLRFDRRRRDRYDRFLAYVYVEDRMLNEELVRAGLAQVRIYPGDSTMFQRRLQLAEQEAKQAGRGIWSGQRR